MSGDGVVLDRQQIYLIKLDTHLSLPANVCGRATGKSSIGRLDVITRLLTENGNEYDVVPAEYDGHLYVLVMPQTFSIKVKPGQSLNQLRLFSGHPLASVVSRSLIGAYGVPFWHVANQDGGYEPWESLIEDDRKMVGDPALFDMTVDLADRDFPYVYEAKQCTVPIDVSMKAHYVPEEFFKRVPIEGNPPSVVLKQNSFYIMKSRERLSIPPDVAVEVVAISERIGDIRIHYAGFAHPGFGAGSAKKGTPLIFEVRATDMLTRLYDGSLLAKMQLFRMSELVKSDPSDSYDKQELKLSKVFRNPQS